MRVHSTVVSTDHPVSLVEGIGAVLSSAVNLFMKSPHILFIDAGFSSDKWVIMLACFMDGNHHIQPVGFELCSGESGSNWCLFLNMLKEAGITEEGVPDLVIVSDQGKGLLAAVHDVFPFCEHVPCVTHLERHFQDRWGKAHGVMYEDNTEVINIFNRMVEYYRRACLAVTGEECGAWMLKARSLEIDYSSFHPVKEVHVD